MKTQGVAALWVFLIFVYNYRTFAPRQPLNIMKGGS